MPKKKSKKKTYYVDIQFTTEFKYKVEAASLEEARSLAQKEYENGGDTYVHAEVFDYTVTNIESVP